MNKTITPETEEVTQEVDKQDVPEAGKEKQAASGRSAKSGKKDEEQLKKLREENDQLKQELSEVKDIYQRMLAEYANYKRRTEQEKEQLSGFVKAETLKALLPALDNLERAVDAPAGDEYKTGIDMTIRQLFELLKSQGFEPIMPVGEAFDPELHHAVMREDAENVEPETVTEVYQKGYRMNGRLIRPAMVKVAN